MPVKWDARTDQILLLKILETSAVSADVKAISDAWPTSEAEKPTPRAITERLGKIRKDVKGGTGSFKVSGQKAAMLTSDVTPQKRAPRGSKTGFGSGSGSVKKSNGGAGGGSNIRGKGVNGNGKRPRSKNNTNGGKNMSDDHARLLSLPPPDASADEDALTVPVSKELHEMLMHYGVIARDDESVDGGDGDDDDRSQTMMPGPAGEDADDEETPGRKKAKKTNGVKVEVEENDAGYHGFGDGQGGSGGFGFSAIGGDAEGKYGGGAIFA